MGLKVETFKNVTFEMDSQGFLGFASRALITPGPISLQPALCGRRQCYPDVSLLDASVGVCDRDLGRHHCACLDADGRDDSSARNAPGLHSGIHV